MKYYIFYILFFIINIQSTIVESADIVNKRSIKSDDILEFESVHVNLKWVLSSLTLFINTTDQQPYFEFPNEILISMSRSPEFFANRACPFLPFIPNVLNDISTLYVNKSYMHNVFTEIYAFGIVRQFIILFEFPSLVDLTLAKPSPSKYI